MSEQQTRIERTGNIRVYQTSPHQPVAYPVKQAEVIQLPIEFIQEWNAMVLRSAA